MEKQFELLTDAELLALTQEEIDWYIKLKKAEKGVKILICPATPEYRSTPDKDITTYEVNGYLFTDRTTAEEISNFINSKISTALKTNYNYNYGYDYKYVEPYEGNLSQVNTGNYYSKQVYDSIKDMISSNDKIKKAYEKVKEEYDAEEEKCTEIVDKIYEAVNKAKERKYQEDEYKIRIQEYLRLANGNTEVAWNFFEKAYTIEPQVKNKILESEEYTNAVKGY